MTLQVLIEVQYSLEKLQLLILITEMDDNDHIPIKTLTSVKDQHMALLKYIYMEGFNQTLIATQMQGLVF